MRLCQVCEWPLTGMCLHCQVRKAPLPDHGSALCGEHRGVEAFAEHRNALRNIPVYEQGNLRLLQAVRALASREMAYYAEEDKFYQQEAEEPYDNQMEESLVQALGHYVQESVN
ncbi:hypothetical protein NDU88_006546 [Pleurodeles waltl]|uniref:Uncharacterized protein n=1 Tax=Pleurodeles waltl TaxID=8319 RepID=A0AAV7WYJ6_PLEWA|nr:hypothetical protein NDU88_006546 [Pleurodeles waltl]